MFDYEVVLRVELWPCPNLYVEVLTPGDARM